MRLGDSHVELWDSRRTERSHRRVHEEARPHCRGGFDHGGYGCGECEVRGSDAEGTRAGHPGGLASSLEVSRG